MSPGRVGWARKRIEWARKNNLKIKEIQRGSENVFGAKSCLDIVYLNVLCVLIWFTIFVFTFQGDIKHWIWHRGTYRMSAGRVEWARKRVEWARKTYRMSPEKNKTWKKGSKGVQIKKIFLVPHIGPLGVPKSEKKFFKLTITLSFSKSWFSEGLFWMENSLSTSIP